MPTAVQQRIECQWFDPDVPRDRAGWRAAIQDTRHDVYHLPEYVQIDASVSGGTGLGFYATDGKRKLFIPFSIRRVPTQHPELAEYYDATSPYGFPSPCTKFSSTDSPDDRASFIQEALGELVLGLRQRNIVAAFVRSHPLLSDCFEGFESSAVVVQHGDSVYCDLNVTDEEMWQQTRRRDRSYINSTRRKGYRLVQDDNWTQLDRFIQIYEETMERVTAADFYYFPKHYFESIRDKLEGNATLVLVMSPDDVVACGGIFTNCNQIVQYHLGGTANEFRHVQPAKLLIDGVRRWGRDQGHHYLHLGGGVGAASDSLLHFKAGFSRLRAPFASSRFVTNQAVYSKLVEHWEQVESRKADSNTGYFPAYRKPMTTLRIIDTNGQSRPALAPQYGQNLPSSASKVFTQKRRAA